MGFGVSVEVTANVYGVVNQSIFRQ